ncbi:biotin transporter BioY [Paenibacillus thermotolerans]|uniref:biotin transporter BioY n=1 Tax=Paenibacillus thermotolerans TaxID=3027807 RepID=UPI0023678B71|nr:MULTISPECIES: biotin transporter BioY [unclassified Paenibacillus]
MKNAFTLRGIAFSALFAALVVVFGYVSIPLGFSPVPITLQTLAVMLAGGLLGARYGFFSMMIVVVLTALGLPLLQGKGGLATLLGPTGGYVVMWPFAAMLIGYTVSKVRKSGWVAIAAIFLAMECFGSLLLYVTGVPWLAHSLGFTTEKALAAGFYPYLPGDTVKAVAATFITVTLRQVFPQQRLTGHGHYNIQVQQQSDLK